MWILRLSFITLTQSAVRGSFSTTISEIQSLHSCQSFRSASRSPSVSTVTRPPPPPVSLPLVRSELHASSVMLLVSSIYFFYITAQSSIMLAVFRSSFLASPHPLSPVSPPPSSSASLPPVCRLHWGISYSSSPYIFHLVLTAQWRLIVKVKNSSFSCAHRLNVKFVVVVFLHVYVYSRPKSTEKKVKIQLFYSLLWFSVHSITVKYFLSNY